MEDDHQDDGEEDELFDVLYAHDDNPDNNALCTLQWLGWRHSVEVRGERPVLVYGIPESMVN